MWESRVADFKNNLGFSLYTVLSTCHLVATLDSENRV